MKNVAFFLVFISTVGAIYAQPAGKGQFKQKDDEIELSKKIPAIIPNGEGVSFAQDSGKETITLSIHKNIMTPLSDGTFGVQIAGAKPGHMYVMKDEAGNIYYIMNGVVVQSTIISPPDSKIETNNQSPSLSNQSSLQNITNQATNRVDQVGNKSYISNSNELYLDSSLKSKSEKKKEKKVKKEKKGKKGKNKKEKKNSKKEEAAQIIIMDEPYYTTPEVNDEINERISNDNDKKMEESKYQNLFEG